MVKINNAIMILILAVVSPVWAQADSEPEDSRTAEPPAGAIPEEGDRGEEMSPDERKALERAQEMLREYYGQDGRGRPRVEVTPWFVEPRSRACLAGGARKTSRGAESGWDPCALGRRLAEMPPCLSPRDCEALNLLTGEVGPPAIRGARPPGDEPGFPHRQTLKMPVENRPVKAAGEDASPSRD